MATEDRKIRLVLKNADCTRVGALSSWREFTCASRVNDVGEAVLVAGFGASDANDARLEALDTADVILEAYVQPPGHAAFLPDPAWAGFLRDSKVEQDGPAKVGTYVFKDYNHLLTRRVIEPPAGASHDEDYTCVPDLMRNLVRRHMAEDASLARQMPGLSVESNECEAAGGVYTGESVMVFGSNAPEWVRVNALLEWNGFLYLGTETKNSPGIYAAIYRSADGLVWTKVLDGAPTVYSQAITSVNCLAPFGADLYAGCSQDWEADDAVVMYTSDGVNWAMGSTLPNHAGVWALAEYDGQLYAGTTGDVTISGSKVYIWRSADGHVWTQAAAAPTNAGNYFYSKTCRALYVWNATLYAGIRYDYAYIFSMPYYHICNENEDWARVEISTDGTTWTNVLSVSSTGPTSDSFLCFEEFGAYLYAGAGRTRRSPPWCYSCVDYATSGQVWRTLDGATWEKVFGDSSEHSESISCILATTTDDGDPCLWAASGWRTGGSAKILRSLDGVSWATVYRFSTISYDHALALAEFCGQHYCALGSFASAGSCAGGFKADHGDVWRVTLAAEIVEDSGLTGRWTTVLDKLRELAEQNGECDFGVVGRDSFLYCGETQAFEFQVRQPQWGTDNRWDGEKGVTFAIQRGNVARAAHAVVRASRPTLLYVLGPSSGEERSVTEFENEAAADESPWGRVEGTVDAQGVDSVETIQSLGWSELELQGPTEGFGFRTMETDACHYVGENADPDHPSAYRLGDIVTASFDGMEADCKIEEVVIHAGEGSPAYEVSVTFDVLGRNAADEGAPESYLPLLQTYGQTSAKVARLGVARWTAASAVSAWTGARWRLTTEQTRADGQLIVDVYCHAGSVPFVKLMSSAGGPANTGVSPDVNPTLTANASGVPIAAGQTKTLLGSGGVVYNKVAYFTVTTGWLAPYSVELEVMGIWWKETFGATYVLWP